MMVGALLDTGIDFAFLKTQLKKISVEGYELELKKVMKAQITASQFSVRVTGKQSERSYSDIVSLIDKSSITAKAKQVALSILSIIAAAESKIHNVDIERVHFHEIGAIDSIIDIAATAIGIDMLKIDEVYSSAIPLGKGFVEARHGMMPIPAPATVEILKDVPVYGGDFDFEVTTPTGAAIVKSLTKNFGALPLMKIRKTGFGSGTVRNERIPNLLRIIVGELQEESDDFTDGYDSKYENMVLLSANLDDISPEIIGYLLEKLFKEKVPDAWTEPIFMKKNRQAIKVCLLCKSEDEEKFSDILFAETSTLGIRRQKIKRLALKREIKLLKLPYGEVNMKIGYLDGKAVTFSPEYESCRSLAQKTGKPVKEIYHDAACFFSIK